MVGACVWLLLHCLCMGEKVRSALGREVWCSALNNHKGSRACLKRGMAKSCLSDLYLDIFRSSIWQSALSEHISYGIKKLNQQFYLMHV